MLSELESRLKNVTKDAKPQFYVAPLKPWAHFVQPLHSATDDNQPAATPSANNNNNDDDDDGSNSHQHHQHNNNNMSGAGEGEGKDNGSENKSDKQQQQQHESGGAAASRQQDEAQRDEEEAADMKDKDVSDKVCEDRSGQEDGAKCDMPCSDDRKQEQKKKKKEKEGSKSEEFAIAETPRHVNKVRGVVATQVSSPRKRRRTVTPTVTSSQEEREREEHVPIQGPIMSVQAYGDVGQQAQVEGEGEAKE